MRTQLPIERRARERIVGELRAQIELELGEGALGLLEQKPDGVVDVARAVATRFAGVGALLGQQSRVAVLAVGAQPTVQGAARNALRPGLTE
jgi:hypothetical protein